MNQYELKEGQFWVTKESLIAFLNLRILTWQKNSVTKMKNKKKSLCVETVGEAFEQIALGH